ncbi:MAG: hypothetical protein MI810_09100, partial [Flavobacteriales bacterium]|nr:hypothetical protein [Flavobacteriales bacterium]
TTQTFKAFKVNSYHFLDSFAFLPGSLQTLSDSLRSKSDHEYKILDQMNMYDKDDNVKKQMLLTKGFFFYEYLTSIKVLEEVSFPEQDAFFSTLSNSGISNEDYEFAKSVYREFNCQNLQDYMVLYMRTDVALLSEVFLAFRKEILKDFGLDCW